MIDKVSSEEKNRSSGSWSWMESEKIGIQLCLNDVINNEEWYLKIKKIPTELLNDWWHPQSIKVGTVFYDASDFLNSLVNLSAQNYDKIIKSSVDNYIYGSSNIISDMTLSNFIKTYWSSDKSDKGKILVDSLLIELVNADE